MELRGYWEGDDLTLAEMVGHSLKVDIRFDSGPWDFVTLTRSQLQTAAQSIANARQAFARMEADAKALADKLTADLKEAERIKREATRVIEPGERVSYIDNLGKKVYGVVAHPSAVRYETEFHKDKNPVWAYWGGYVAYPAYMNRDRLTVEKP